MSKLLKKVGEWIDQTLDEIKRARLTYYYWKTKQDNK